MLAAPKKLRAAGGGHDLGAGLAGAVRVVPAERVALAKGDAGAGILVALVARDVDDDAHRWADPHRLEQVDRPHDVRGERADGVAVRGAHQRLGGEVEDEFGFKGGHGTAQRGEVAYVARDVRDLAAQGGELEEARIGGRRQGVAADYGARGSKARRTATSP